MENDQIKQIEKEMKDMGCELILNPIQVLGKVLRVEVDLDIVIPLDWINKATIVKTTKRGTKFYCSFNQLDSKLTLNFFTEVPSYFDYGIKDKIYGTTFPDLCWIYSSGTTPENKNEVATVFREEAIPGDLTWLLPSKFVDDLIEMIHTINPTFMSGLMQDAIIYTCRV